MKILRLMFLLYFSLHFYVFLSFILYSFIFQINEVPYSANLVQLFLKMFNTAVQCLNALFEVQKLIKCFTYSILFSYNFIFLYFTLYFYL